MYIEEKEFLSESNKIEGVFDKQSLTDALEAWRYLAKEKELTINNVLKTHKILMLHQSINGYERGYFRKRPVWIANKEALHYSQIKETMEAWIKKANKSDRWIDIKEDHIKYGRIHPFIDGNGRTGRIFMNWARLKCGSSLLTIYKNEVEGYYDWFE